MEMGVELLSPASNPFLRLFDHCILYFMSMSFTVFDRPRHSRFPDNPLSGLDASFVYKDTGRVGENVRVKELGNEKKIKNFEGQSRQDWNLQYSIFKEDIPIERLKFI